jgi:hypothetical protein
MPASQDLDALRTRALLSGRDQVGELTLETG